MAVCHPSVEGCVWSLDAAVDEPTHCLVYALVSVGFSRTETMIISISPVPGEVTDKL